MPQILRCPHCQKSMQVPDNAAGKTVKCPSCTKPFTVPAAAAPAPAAPGRPASTPDLNLGNGAKPAASSTPSKCPACGSSLLEGAVSCMDCGFLVHADTSQAENEAPPVICVNPACGVANPPGERNCQRCGNPLPMAGGTLINNRYRLERQLAVGGFGAVYLASDTKNNNRQVAIKDMIGDDPQEFAIRLNFFRREYEILRALESVPIVPRVLEFINQDTKTARLVMEFIRGRDLLKIMEGNDNKPFPIPQVIEWGKAVCSVLEHMHNQNPPLIHRDLKPDNIMLLEDGKSIKMIDFGTARDLGSSLKDRMAGKTRVYTEGYAPPEQIIGKPEPRSDIFALAGTLYHLVTGEAPEGQYTVPKIDALIAEGKTPASYRWFFELIKINLADDINERYYSAREMREDLERQKVSKERVCPKCKTVNPDRTYAFCMNKNCGHALTDKSLLCTACGKLNQMGARYCNYCGNRCR